MAVISNSTPLIYLSALGDIRLLPDLFRSIMIPQAVYREVVLEGKGQSGEAEVREAVGSWLTVADPLEERQLPLSPSIEELHAGEMEAILLAHKMSAEAILLDDRRAVEVAREQGLSVVRTPAIYVAAKQRGKIARVRPKLDLLRAFGFRLKDRDYEAVLRFAGEL